MNKKALMPALLAATGSFAAATGTIGLEVRSDFVYETWNNVEVADPSDFLKNSAGGDSLDASGKKVLSGAKMDREPGFGFNAARLRTDFKGQFANDVKYRLRLRLDKTLGTNAKINSVNSLDGAVDQAWIQPKFGDVLSVRIGRYGVDGQGYEEAVVSSQDTYIFSTIDKYYLAGKGTVFGVRPTLHFEGLGDVNITLGNTDAKTTEDSLSQDKLVYGIGYTGKFGMVEPLLNVHMVPKTDWTEGQLDAAVGLRVTVDKFVGIADFQSQTGTGDALIAKNLDQVLSGNMVLQYKGDNLRPQAKVFYDQLSFEDDKTASVLGLAGGLEYYPEADAKYRYHLMVSDRMTTPVVDGEDGDTQSEIKVYAGLSCSLDMWKF